MRFSPLNGLLLVLYLAGGVAVIVVFLAAFAFALDHTHHPWDYMVGGGTILGLFFLLGATAGR